MSRLSVTVVGSVNLDYVARAPKLPAPGETVTGATLSRHPGGKGANQALAARRLGAAVRLIGRVGADGAADEALALLQRDGVDLDAVAVDARLATGVALISVAEDGENQIVVAPGANAAVTPTHLPARFEGPLILQLELPLDTVVAAVDRAEGFVCLNLAPAAGPLDAAISRADLVVVNETEAAFYGQSLFEGSGLVAVTLGARGARLFRDGRRIAEAPAPIVRAVDTVGAGDSFVAALTLALLEGREPAEALRFACYAGAIATTRAGAQPSLPTRTEVETLIARDTGPGAFA
jgi:ribokinase